MRDDDDKKPISDSDRAAILARRKQFIALALSGLTTTAACTDGKDVPAKKPQDNPTEQKAQPCLSVPAPHEPEPQVCLSVAPPEPPPEEVRPQPCLKIAAPEPQPEEVPPQVCLKMAMPEPEPEPKPEPAPRPCLKKKMPDSP